MMSGLGSTRIGNIPSGCGFSWFLQIERTCSTHFDAVATPFLPFSLPWTRGGTGWGDSGRMRGAGRCWPPGRDGAAQDVEAAHAGLASARGERTRDAGWDGVGTRCGAGRARDWLGRGERMRGGAGHWGGRALTAEAERWGHAVLCASGWATT